MFPFAFFIDCNGDMWVPCVCSPSGASGPSGTTGAAEEIELDEEEMF